jgi:hypothetical protein
MGECGWKFINWLNLFTVERWVSVGGSLSTAWLNMILSGLHQQANQIGCQILGTTVMKGSLSTSRLKPAPNMR